jgi:replicative DNA helicase
VNGSNGYPASKEAERTLLGCVLVGTPELQAEMATKVRADWFYHPATRIFWDVVAAFQAEAKPVDQMLIQQHLMDHTAPNGARMLDEVGGPSAVFDNFNCVASAENWKYYAEIVEKKYIRRCMLQLGALATKLALDEETDEKEILAEVEAELFAIHSLQDVEEPRVLREALLEHTEHVERLYKSRGRIAFGIATGIVDLDRMVNGVEPGEMMIIGARPGVGKTNFMNRLVENIALREEAPVPSVFFTAEMGKLQILTRLTHGAAGVETIKGRDGFYSQRDLDAYANQITKWYHKPLWIDQSPDLTIADVMVRVRMLHKKHGIKAVFLDYLQLIKPVTKRGLADERLGIVEVCNGLKIIARQLELGMFVLAQANRGSEDNPGKLPILRDFDGSSAIEKFADYAGFIHRPCKFKDWKDLKEKQQEEYINEEEYRQAAQLLLVKNRNGSEGKIELKFIEKLSRFEPVTLKLYSNNPNERQKIAS